MAKVVLKLAKNKTLLSGRFAQTSPLKRKTVHVSVAKCKRKRFGLHRTVALEMLKSKALQ